MSSMSPLQFQGPVKKLNHVYFGHWPADRV